MSPSREPAPAPAVQDDGGRGILEITFTVGPEYHGWRLDRFLKRRIRRLSRTRIQRILRAQVRRQGDGDRPLKPSSAVFAGDVLVLRRPAPREPDCPREIGVLFDDPDVLVVDKPAGLPVHPTARYYRNTLTSVLAERFPGQALQPAHRLDRETSGALVVARGRDAGSALKRAFAARRVHKEYLALVRGEVDLADGEEGTIDLPLALDPRSAVKIRMAPAPGGLPATTHFHVLRRLRGHTLVAARPVTGRQHQIRAHLAAAGHPVLGDKLYGAPEELFAEWAARGLTPEMIAVLGAPRQLLHAWRVAFPHPRTGTLTTVTAPPPADLLRVVERLAPTAA